jgi:hypothetical protein
MVGQSWVDKAMGVDMALLQKKKSLRKDVGFHGFPVS